MLIRGGHIHRFRTLCSYIRQHNIELIFSYLTAANLYACLAAKLSGTQVVTGLRNAELPILKRMVDKYLTNHMAALTIANCFSGKRNFVSQGFCKKKIHVIPNCFDNILPYKDKKGSDKTSIITVGRFVEQGLPHSHKECGPSISDLQEHSVLYHWLWETGTTGKVMGRRRRH